MYGLLHYLNQHYPAIRGGFVHVPYLPEQAAKYPGSPSMPVEMMTAALKIAIESTSKNDKDIPVTGGKIN